MLPLNDCIGENMSVRIISIDSKYFNELNSIYNKQCFLKPYFNKRLDGSRFNRPYLCLNYSTKFKYIEVFPLSSFKPSKDNLGAKYFKFIVVGKKIKAKIVLNCVLTVPIRETTLINLSKYSLQKCQKQYKEILIDLKDELQFCEKYYKFIKEAYYEYVKEYNAKNPSKYKLLDSDLNKQFNKEWEERKTNVEIIK